MDLFIYDKPTYIQKRDFDMVSHYVNNMAIGLSKLENIPFEKAKEFITNGIKTGVIHIEDPVVRSLKREVGGDRRKYTTTVSKYLREVVDNKHIMAPTFTAYCHPSVEVSEYSTFTNENVNDRNAKKKLALKYKQEGDKLREAMAVNGQLGAKLNNNSMSGAFKSEYNLGYNRSAHSSLTSVCRTCASFANINNERFMMGWRHFFSVDVVVENILSVLAIMDYDECRRIIEKYNLHYITKEEFRECVRYSTQQSFRGKKLWKKLDEFIDTLDALERTIYFYTADFYHLRKFNDSFVREMFRRIISVDVSQPHPEPDVVAKTIDEDMGMLAGILLSEQLNYKAILHSDTRNSEQFPNLMYAVSKVQETITDYTDLIQCFWRNDCLPHDTADMPDMVRNCVLGGDTDSTLFTVMNWCEWYRGGLDDTPESMSVAQTIIYFTSMMVRHYLAYVSAIIGIPAKYLYMMAMKNEFMFPIFVTTRRTKNYIATVCAQEGNLYKEFDEEIKGPVLKGNKLPSFVLTALKKMIDDITTVAWTTRTLSLAEHSKRIADVEYAIYDSICKGSTEFLSKADIKPKENYGKPMSSNYASYDLWQNVFAEKYGEIASLPVQGIKVSLDTKTRAQTQAWVNRIQDVKIRERMREWLSVNNKTGLTSLILPIDVIATHGLPEELHSAINFRKIIYELTEGFYLLLESICCFMVNKDNTRLCLDSYPELFESDSRYWAYMSNTFDASDVEDDD